MSNPFNLTDEQINELGKFMLGYTLDKTWGDYAREVLAEAERMAKENAQSAFTVDWDNVPPEYRFAAADESGRIYFYTKSVVPLLASPVWYIPEPGGNWIMRGFCQAVADGKIDWRTTLRKRPPTHA